MDRTTCNGGHEVGLTKIFDLAEYGKIHKGI